MPNEAVGTRMFILDEDSGEWKELNFVVVIGAGKTNTKSYPFHLRRHMAPDPCEVDIPKRPDPCEVDIPERPDAFRGGSRKKGGRTKYRRN